MKSTTRLLGISLVVAVAAATFYMKGRYDERAGKGFSPVLQEAQAKQPAHAPKWSPTIPEGGGLEGWLSARCMESPQQRKFH